MHAGEMMCAGVATHLHGGAAIGRAPLRPLCRRLRLPGGGGSLDGAGAAPHDGT